MTIDSVELISETGTKTKDGASYERVYHVYFSAGYSTAALLANTHPDLPQNIGDAHPEDIASFVATIRPQLVDESAPDEGVATYTVSYAPRTGDALNAPAVHPLSRPPVISGAGGIGISEVVYQTTDATPVSITNSSGDLYSPLPERPKRGSRTTITFNTDTHPGAWAETYSNTLNSAAFHGKSAGQCLMEEITWAAKSEVYQGATVNYYEATCPIRSCPEGWRFKAVDNGHAKLDDDGKKVAVTDTMGIPNTVPVLLDGNGGVLADGANPVIYPASGYKVFYEADWGPLSLPNPFS